MFTTPAVADSVTIPDGDRTNSFGDSGSMAPRSDQKEEVAEAKAEAAESHESEAEIFQEDDAEAAELARLRCESVRTEEKKQPGTKFHSFKNCGNTNIRTMEILSFIHSKIKQWRKYY